MPDFLVEAMSCGHCVDAVTRAIHGLDPGAEVKVDLGARRVRVRSEIDDALICGALREAGYEPVPLAPAA